MAKGNLVLGTASKVIGDIVMYRRNGNQVARVRNRTIKNPKTEAQYIQRVIMNTVSQAYSKMKVITDHSFEGVTVGQANMSRFMRDNLNYLRQQVMAVFAADDSTTDVNAFVPLKTKYLAPNKYIVSQGSLRPVNFRLLGLNSITPTLAYNGFIPGVGASGAATYQDVCDALGLQRGDQLTFVAITGNFDSIISSPNNGGAELYFDGDKVAFEYARVILDPVDNGAAAPMSTAFLAGTTINKPNDRNEGVSSFGYSIASDAAGGLYVSKANSQIQAFGVIVSRKKDDGTWDYSPCQMVVPVYEAGNKSIYWAWDLADAVIASQPQTTSTSNYYLRQAEKKN